MSKISSEWSRRRFLNRGVLAGSALIAGGSLVSDTQGASAKRFKLIGFSKPFQTLEPEAMADFVAEVGWDGIECPVRPRGQIEPERAQDELPVVVEALKKRGLTIEIMTTRIDRADEPLTESLLRLAKGLGIPRYRMNYWKYDRTRPVMEQLDEHAGKLKDLAALNAEIGIQGCYQNHSGRGYVGAPIWDLHYMIRDLDPRWMATCFDIGHATVEGGYAWETHAQLMRPRFGAVYLKDFTWERTGKGWKSQWCPVGEGMVNRQFFKGLLKSDFAGPIAQHHEYPVGEGREMLRNLKRDLRVLKDWLAG